MNIGRVFRIWEVDLKGVGYWRIHCQEKLEEVLDGFRFHESAPHGPTNAG